MRRIRRAVVAYWIAAVGLAGVTGVIVASLVREAEDQAARYGVVTRVLVARQSIAVGAVIRSADVAERQMPRAFIPTGRLATSVLGRTVVVPLAQGEVVLASKLAPEGLRGVAALLRSGERALALPLGPGTPPLGLGDRVDVLATNPSDGVTVVVAHAARVVGLDAQAVTVAVRAAETPGVAAALAAATVTLALAGQ